MAKRRDGAAREAARRGAPRVPPVSLERLGMLAADLATLERDRLALLGRRDVLVAQLRAAGYPWTDLAIAAGTTRQALMKRQDACTEAKTDTP